jgi:hypothetical protein
MEFILWYGGEGPPNIASQSLPEEERAPAFALKCGLSDLMKYEGQLAAALSLYDDSMAKYWARGECVPGAPELDWADIAKRDGAMTIYHFGEACDGISSSLRKCPTLLPLVNLQALNNALRPLRVHFSDRVSVRNVVGHSVERTQSPVGMQDHSFSGLSQKIPGIKTSDTTTGLTLTVNSDRTLAATWKNRIVSYELSKETLATITAIKLGVWNAFRPSQTPATS